MLQLLSLEVKTMRDASLFGWMSVIGRAVGLSAPNFL